jgi:hypothetical protein
MAYFIFAKDSDNIDNTLYRIAENQSDLNNLNIEQSIYKIIEESQSNFDLVKYGTKIAKKYNNNVITYVDFSYNFLDKNQLNSYVQNVIPVIKEFLDKNKEHPLFNLWNNYCNQLKLLNLNNIIYPLNKSLEQYFKDQGQTSLNSLQLP